MDYLHRHTSAVTGLKEKLTNIDGINRNRTIKTIAVNQVTPAMCGYYVCKNKGEHSWFNHSQEGYEKHGGSDERSDT